MKAKKVLVSALIINTIVSFIPIPHKTLTGTECPDYCYEYMPSYGFPIPLLTSNGINSPIGSLNTDFLHFPYGIGLVLFAVLFLMNVLIFGGIIEFLVTFYEEIKKY